MKRLLLLVAILHLSFGDGEITLPEGAINLQDIEIPDIDDFAAVKEKCDRLGGNGTYDALKGAKDAFATCVQNEVDFTNVKSEVEEAKKTGSMDEVFGKYCAKRPKVATCVQNLTSNLKSCLETDEKKALNTTLDVLKQLGEFICFRDGDRIAMFVAEGGVECIQDHTEGIKNCVNSTFNITPTVNTNSLPNLLIDSKKCKDLSTLQNCVVTELEKCKDSTPANIVDALFRFIKRSACPDKPKRSIHSIIRRSAQLANSIYSSAQASNALISTFREKCKQNAPNGGLDALNASISKTVACVRNVKVFTTPLSEIKIVIKNCSQEFIEKAAACLPQEEKYWPQFNIDMIVSVLDFAYSNQDKLSGKNLKQEIQHCFLNFKQQEAKDEISKCFQKADDPISFQKKDVCNRITNFTTCVSGVLDKKCTPDVAVAEVKNQFFAALSAPCNK